MTGDNHPQIRFAEQHVDRLLAGEKTVTIRYAFDHEFEPGDTVVFVTDTGQQFATATILTQFHLRADWVAFAEMTGHAQYETTAELLAELEEYYPDADLTGETILDVVVFEVESER